MLCVSNKCKNAQLNGQYDSSISSVKVIKSNNVSVNIQWNWENLDSEKEHTEYQHATGTTTTHQM